MRPKEVDEFAARGILVHQIMSGDRELVDGDDNATKMYVKKLNETVDTLGLTIHKREFWAEGDITKGVHWVAKIDFDAHDTLHKYVLGDWKTAGGSWKALETANGGQIWPQGATFQASSYLHSCLWSKTRPRALFYVVASFRGPGQVIVYRRNRRDEEALLDAIHIVKRQQTFPKVYARHCLECKFRHACFKLPGWKDKYESKTNEL